MIGVFPALAFLLVLTTVPFVYLTLSRGATEPTPLAVVRRVDLTLTVRTRGLVASAVRTIVRCPVKNLRGRRAATTILELTPEGTVVDRGDVLCRLDSSEYEELEHRQRIDVLQSRADHRRAALDLDAARTALEEYELGRHLMERDLLEARVAETRSEVTRTTDRLAWSRRMLDRGYASRAQIANETSLLERAQIEQERAELALRTYDRLVSPKTMLELKNRVEGARADLLFQTARLRKEEQRLTLLQQQVEQCTIRAPHGGLLIYAHKPKRDVRIEEGLQVHRRQELFYLPDLSRLELLVRLHETVVARVKPGMTARIWLEEEVEPRTGTVAEIGQMPIADRNKWSSNEVKNFIGRIPLEATAITPHPGATADVEITTERLHDVVAVPFAAVKREQGRDVCYVAAGGGFEPRPIVLGQADDDWQEVIDGLAVGEQVALSPPPETAIHP